MSVIALVLLVFVFEDKPYTPKCFRTVNVDEKPDQVPKEGLYKAENEVPIDEVTIGVPLLLAKEDQKLW